MSRQSTAALIVVLDFSAIALDEFNDWYDTEHIPERVSIPGFDSAERWLAEDGSKRSLALYELSDLAVLEGKTYAAVAGVNFSPWSKRIMARCEAHRFEAELILRKDKPGQESAAALLFVAMNVSAETEKDFNDWYDTEHIPALMALPGVLAARRYRTNNGAQKYVAVYHLDDAALPKTPEWAAATNTPWSARARAQTSDVMRGLFKRYRRA